jgi:hypothetical protein
MKAGLLLAPEGGSQHAKEPGNAMMKRGSYRDKGGAYTRASEEGLVAPPTTQRKRNHKVRTEVLKQVVRRC